MNKIFQLNKKVVQSIRLLVQSQLPQKLHNWINLIALDN